MSKENQCSICGRQSSAKSVLRESKDKKGVISFHCTNSKKCAEDKKAGLTDGQRKKKIVAKKKGNGKKAAPAKKVEKKKIKTLKPIAEEETAKEAQATA